MIISSFCWLHLLNSGGLSCPFYTDFISSSKPPFHWPSQRTPQINLTLLSYLRVIILQLFYYSYLEVRWPTQESQMLEAFSLFSSSAAN